MECNVCLNEWHSEKCIPRMLPCGHSFCSACLNLLFKHSQKQVSCPTCLIDHQVASPEQIDKLFCKNWSLIALAESAQQTPGGNLLQMKLGLGMTLSSSRGSVRPRVSSTGDSVLLETSKRNIFEKVNSKRRRAKSGFPMSEDCISVSSDASDEEIKMQQFTDSSESESGIIVGPPHLKREQTCSIHPNQIIHSYQRQTRRYLCTQCVQETELATEDIVIFPAAVNHMKARIMQTKALNKQRRMQLTSVMTYLTEVQTNNRKIIERQFHGHLAQIQRIFEAYQQRAKQSLKDAYQSQDRAFHQAEQQISEYLDQLANDEISLQALEVNEDDLLIYMTQTIEDLHSKTVKFVPEINLEDTLVSIQLRNSTFEKLTSVLDEAVDFQTEQLKEGEQVMTTEKILAKDEHWLCPSCGIRIDGSENRCVGCICFKPVTYQKNIIFSPHDTSQHEIDHLNHRREFEKEMLISADREAGQQLSMQRVWYMIPTRWLFEWKCFVANKVIEDETHPEWAEEVLESANHQIGVLPPGPISTHLEFMDSQLGIADKLKKGLRVNIHYKAVNSNVWYLLSTNYGVLGPHLPREALDIYSKDLQGMLKIYQSGQILTPVKREQLAKLSCTVEANMCKVGGKSSNKSHGSSSSKGVGIIEQLFCDNELDLEQ